MVSGGAAWPRDGNRPVYFWMSLKSGKVVTFPIGWDLEYFSANQKVAVFGTTLKKGFDRRPLQAVDVGTGEMLTAVPSRPDGVSVPFNWTETQTVKPLYLRRRSTGDEDYLSGISVNGSIFPFAANIDFGRAYLSTAKAHDGFAGFRLRGSGALNGEPSPFWMTQLKPEQNPKLIAAKVTDFARLNEGNCVFVTAGHGHKGESSEAFFRVPDNNATWNVLDEIERLSELDKEFVDKDYVQNKMTIRLIESFGQQHDPLVLCLFRHSRGDMRSFDFNLREHPKTVERATWRRALILTSTGQRYMTQLFREGNDPDYIWLHSSGRVIMGTVSWVLPNPDGDRKIHLSETTLALP